MRPRSETAQPEIPSCDDGSDEAERAVETAAALLAPHHAVEREASAIVEPARGSVSHDSATPPRRPVTIVPSPLQQAV